MNQDQTQLEILIEIGYYLIPMFGAVVIGGIISDHIVEPLLQWWDKRRSQ